MAPRYKFVELTVVTEETLEDTVNHWVAQGWRLDQVRFVTGEASRRPSMAFVSFIREDDGGAEAPRTRPGREARQSPARGSVPWEGVEPSRVHKVIELGEIDLGAAEPYEVEIGYSDSPPRKRTPTPAKPSSVRRGKKGR